RFLCNFYALDSEVHPGAGETCPERKFCSLRAVLCAIFTRWTAKSTQKLAKSVQSVNFAHPEPFSVQFLRAGQ
ncbi:MAG: hypothetical protein QM296_03685, partial [Bacillota bacterium]|nr:hypothetical protein [Bacillota bacterium]